MERSIESVIKHLYESGNVSEFLQVRRRGLFEQIHEIVFYGKGGYDFETVYSLPIWLRNFTYNKLRMYYEEEAEAAEGKSQKLEKEGQRMPKEVSTAIENKRKSDLSIKRLASK